MPKGTPLHRLTDVQGGSAVCASCGPVDVQWRTQRGRRVPRCGVARRNEPGRDRWHTAPRLPWPSHGLTPPQARARVDEAGCCEACGVDTRLGQDHAHSTGVLRGVLCARCNLTLGWVHDDPAVLRALAAYVERYRTPPVPTPV